jgi:hypothetical protein
VPANTSAEWNSFLNHLPSGVTISACCAGNYGQTCYSAYNDCGQRNSSTYDCSGNCPATTPADPSYYGQTCYSSYNDCSQRNSGTYNCSDVCSASTPADPSYYNTSCSVTSPQNSCGQTQQCGGTYNCADTCVTGTCNAPSNSGCPIYGCTDSNAFNYNSGANTNDGSCHYNGCYTVYYDLYTFGYYGGDAIDICRDNVYGPDSSGQWLGTCSGISTCTNDAASYSNNLSLPHYNQCDDWSTNQSGVGIITSVDTPYSCN